MDSMINDLLRLHLIIMQLVKPKNVKMTMQQKSRSNTIKMCNISDIQFYGMKVFNDPL